MPTAEIMEPIRVEYEPKILALLERVRKAILDDGRFECSDVFDMHDDEFRWDFAVYEAEPGVPTGEEADGNPVNPIMDVSLTIVEKDVRGDDEHETDYGISFMVDVVAWGGAILGGYAPYNYSDRLWVWGDEDIAERWNLMDDVDWSAIVESAERALEIAKESENDDDE